MFRSDGQQLARSICENKSNALRSNIVNSAIVAIQVSLDLTDSQATMKCNLPLLLAAVALVDTVGGFAPPLTPNMRNPFSSSRLQYKAQDFRENLGGAYDYWCKIHGHEANAARKEIFSYHYLLAERFFQNTGVRLELNQHADLTDQEYVNLLSEKDGGKQNIQLHRPPAMEAEHNKFQAAYGLWCQTYNKEMNESRLEIFAYHHLLAEQHLEETGTVLELNEYADRTEEEYKEKLDEKKNDQEPQQSVIDPMAATQPSPVPASPAQPEAPNQNFRNKDWWDGGGSSSDFQDWWEGGASLTSSSYRQANRSAASRWQKSAEASLPQTSTQDQALPAKEAAKDVASSSKDFWGFLGTPTTGVEETKVAPEDTSAQGSVSPSYARDPAQSAKSPEVPVASKSTSTPEVVPLPLVISDAQDKNVPSSTTSPSKSAQDAASPLSMTSYQQDRTSTPPAQSSRTPPASPYRTNSGTNDWWGSGSIADMSPYYDDQHKSRVPSTGASSKPPKSTPLIPTESLPTTTGQQVPSQETNPKMPPYEELLTAIESAASSEWWNGASISSHEMDGGSSIPPTPKNEEQQVVSTMEPMEAVVASSDTGKILEAKVETVDAVEAIKGNENNRRLTAEYENWCKAYGKEISDSRRKVFARNFLWAEEYSQESGVELEMNEHADLTEKEYRLVLASGDGAGPSNKSSVLSTRKKKNLDLYKFQQRLLQMRIEINAKALGRQKAKETELANYEFQRRLLEARIKFDALAVQREKEKKECAFQQGLLAARIKNDFVRSELEKGKKKTAFQQRLLGARIGYEASIKKHYVAEGEEMNTEVAVEDVSKTHVEEQKASLHEILFDSKLDIHFEKDKKRGEELAPAITVVREERCPADHLTVEKVVTPTEVIPHRISSKVPVPPETAEPVKSSTSPNMQSNAFEKEETPHLATASVTKAPTAPSEKELGPQKPATEPRCSPPEAEKLVTNKAAPVIHGNDMDSSFPKVVAVVPARSENSSRAETIVNEETETSNTPAVTAGPAGKTVKVMEETGSNAGAESALLTNPSYVFVSSYQGLTGPSKAGLALAIALTIGLAATSPTLDHMLHVDWTQPGLADLSAMSNAAQDSVDGFVHNAQGNLASVHSHLSEMQSSWVSGMQDVGHVLVGRVEAAKESVAASMDGLGKGVGEWRAAQAEDLHAASQSLSEWQSERAQEVQSARNSVEESVDAVKESGVSSFQELKASASDLTGMLSEWSSQQK